MHKYIFVLFALLLLNSCNQSTVFIKYKPISDNKWHKDSIVSFNINIKDTISTNVVFINLRNDKDYDFNNIFLIVGIDYPNKTKVIDTLAYKMTDDKGYFLGTGITDIKESKLFFREQIKFPTKGNYKFHVQQAMRKNGSENGIEKLIGITDVGVEIEKLIN